MTGSTQVPNPWEQQRLAMGSFIRHQRQTANMSLRRLAEVTKVSNAYLSQVERGLHDPTIRVLLQIGDALHVSLEEMLATTNVDEGEGMPIVGDAIADAIALDLTLTTGEKSALLAVYRSYTSSSRA